MSENLLPKYEGPDYPEAKGDAPEYEFDCWDGQLQEDMHSFFPDQVQRRDPFIVTENRQRSKIAGGARYIWNLIKPRTPRQTFWLSYLSSLIGVIGTIKICVGVLMAGYDPALQQPSDTSWFWATVITFIGTGFFGYIGMKRNYDIHGSFIGDNFLFMIPSVLTGALFGLSSIVLGIIIIWQFLVWGF